MGDAEHALLMTMHHIIGDAWSSEIIATEIAASYLAIRAGLTPMLAELPVQYPDFAAWQRDCFTDEVREELLDYWRGKLTGMRTLELPFGRPLEAGAPRVTRMHAFQAPAGLKPQLRRLCREEGATPFMLFLAAFKALLHNCSGSDDITVCVPTATAPQPGDASDGRSLCQ